MSTNNGSVLKGIKDSWSLIDFAKSHGKMQVGEFVNQESGEIFKSCIFTNPNDKTRTFVASLLNLVFSHLRRLQRKRMNYRLLSLIVVTSHFAMLVLMLGRMLIWICKFA